MPAGRSSSRFSPTPSGMSANSSSIEPMPIVASISRRSASVTDVYLLMAAKPRRGLPAAYVVTIGGGVDYALPLAWLGEFDLPQPALAVRVLIDLLGRVGKRLIRLGD